jgi:hypothetical protein
MEEQDLLLLFYCQCFRWLHLIDLSRTDQKRTYLLLPQVHNASFMQIHYACTVLFCDLFFLFINFGKNINFTSLPLKNYLTNFVANSILYNYGGSSKHVLSFKALTQVICPGDFRVACSFFCTDLFFI